MLNKFNICVQCVVKIGNLKNRKIKAMIFLYLFFLIQGLDGLCQEGNSTSWIDLEDYDYKSNTIPNEVIVKFKGFYQTEARKNYIEAALNHDFNANILERTNIMAQYPSDFDVVNFQDDIDLEFVINKLTSHPLIKSVTPQRKVTRHLKSLRKSLTLQNSAAFWQSTGRHSSRRLLRSVPRQITATMQVLLTLKVVRG